MAFRMHRRALLSLAPSLTAPCLSNPLSFQQEGRAATGSDAPNANQQSTPYQLRLN